MSWAPDLVAVSILLGIVFGAIAMWTINTQGRHRWGTRLSPLLLVLAIVSHHFTAMGAVTVQPDPTRTASGLMLSPGSMSLTITMAAIAVPDPVRLRRHFRPKARPDAR